MGQLSIGALWFRGCALRTSGEVAHAAEEGGNALEIRVAHHYATAGTTTFSLDANFQVQPGVTILRGHSGAGKSTLLRCIAGLTALEFGSIAVGSRILFDSQRKINLEPRYRNVAFVFQHLALFPHLSVHDNVAYGLRKVHRAERERRAGAVMDSFHIEHLARHLPKDISGGEQQRVALARALVTEPSVLLLDEPLSSLDVSTKALIIDDLRAWNAAHRIPIIYVTHDKEEARALGERVITLERGRIAADDSLVAISGDSYTPSHYSTQQIENFFNATIHAVHEAEGTVTCRVQGSTLDFRMASAPRALGTQVRIGLRAGKI